MIDLPTALYPGKFYIRFDSTAGFTMPSTTGTATVAMADPSGNTTVSKGFYIRPTFTAVASMGFISGTVMTSNGVSVPAAVVIATTYGAYPSISTAARRGWVGPVGTTVNAYTTATGSNGSYTLSVPPGVYNLRIELWNHKGGVANGRIYDFPSTVSVADGALVMRDYYGFAPLP
jgi:hypothetical protein